jgi:GDPmannose 4,6-dehydratase
MKTAIITGITGQDGAYLGQLLIKKGYKVIGLTRGSTKSNNLEYLQIEDQIEIEECDLNDISAIIKIIIKYKPSEFYNLAAQSSVGKSFEQPIGTINYNVTSVLNILESIRITEKNIKFYQASSSEMYGSVASLPITLNTPMHPLSPYAISKAAAFWIVANYRESYGIYCCNGVLFNHESYLRSNKFFIKKVISECVKFRNDKQWYLKVGNIDIKRDFGFSPKYVEAMFLMLQQNKANDFIICSGKSISLRSIINYIFRKLDIPIDRLKIQESLYRPIDIQDIYGDPSLAKQLLSWDYNMDFYEVLDILIAEEIENIF